MDTQTYIFAAMSAFLGMLLHIFLLKIPSAKDRAKAANLNFSIGEWFGAEWPSLAGNVAAIIIGLLIAKEVLNYKPELKSWIITFAAFYGFTGSTILLGVFSTISKRINSVVDTKTNIADEVTPNPVTTIEKKVEPK